MRPTRPTRLPHLTTRFLRPGRPTRPSHGLLRALPALGTLAGVVHLLAPERLLAIARWAYDRVLAVDFEPRPNATRRVRLVGLAFVAASVLLARLLPDD